MSLIINSLWIGRQLGDVHAACLKSFIDKGHRVVLHSFGTPDDTPKGVEMFDAERLMNETEIARISSGNLALASDIYRYRILKEGLGLYVDCDVFCLKPLKDTQYILGWEDNNTVNGAVLKVPHDSEMLRQLLVAAEDPYFIPPWLKKNKILKSKLKKLLGVPKPVSKQFWGTIGPLLITHVVKTLALEENVSPIDIFYPMHYDQTSLLYQKGLSLKDIITPRTEALHLFNAAMKRSAVMADTPIYEILNA